MKSRSIGGVATDACDAVAADAAASAADAELGAVVEGEADIGADAAVAEVAIVAA
jgi:hypothetical protein